MHHAQLFSGQDLDAGKVVDVRRTTSEGFARGHLDVEGTASWASRSLRLEFQNENLVATCDGTVLATVPDLICCLEASSTLPFCTKTLHCHADLRSNLLCQTELSQLVCRF